MDALSNDFQMIRKVETALQKMQRFLNIQLRSDIQNSVELLEFHGQMGKTPVLDLENQLRTIDKLMITLKEVSDRFGGISEMLPIGKRQLELRTNDLPPDKRR